MTTQEIPATGFTPEMLASIQRGEWTLVRIERLAELEQTVTDITEALHASGNRFVFQRVRALKAQREEQRSQPQDRAITNRHGLPANELQGG